jgi:prephenate dehydrogenase
LALAMDEPGFADLQQSRVMIAGLGLMGGSLALALRGHCRQVLGFDVHEPTQAAALETGLVDGLCPPQALNDFDVLVLAAPARAIVAQLEQLSSLNPNRAVIVMDLGSTKAAIVQAMQALPDGFDPIGGHPMCGKEVGGLAHAEAGLFRGKVFVLTPLARTSRNAFSLAQRLVMAIGARPMVLQPEEHDRLAAVSSHLPYAAAATLMRTAETLGDERVWGMAASGFRDTSRLAASDVTMMLDIMLTNRPAILHALGLYRDELEKLFALLEGNDADGLATLLASARARRRELYQ